MSFKSCTPMPRVVSRSIVITIMSLAWELMCIRTLPLAHWSSFWCGRRFHMSLTLVCCGSFSSLKTCCSSQTPRRSVSPSSRHGRKVWKVKSSIGLSMAELWMSVAPCLMWKPLSATYVISCAPVPLLPDVVWPGESSGNSCLF